MKTTETVMLGSVKPDGTLELDAKLPLPAGRVQVTVRPVVEAAPSAENPWQYLLRVRAERETAGELSRTAEEIEAEREDFRAGDDRIDKLYEEIERRRAGAEDAEC